MINDLSSLLLTILIVTCPYSMAASAPSIGKVLVVKGKVSALFPHTLEARIIKKGDGLQEDTSILSGEKSFAKIKLVDGSVLTVGPKSKIVVEIVDKKKASIVTLLKGKLRAKIEKEKAEESGEESFFVRTRSASAGVRGTEFMTTFNQKSKRTSLLAYEGVVAFAKAKKIEKPKKVNNKARLTSDLKEIFKAKTEVVSVGDFTTVGVQDSKPIKSVKVSHQQFAMLKNDSTLGVVKRKIKRSELVKETRAAKALYKIKKNTEGGALKSGGLISVNEGFYIPPKEGKVVGKVSVLGNYIPPKGLKLDAIKGFVPKVNSEEFNEKAKELNNETLKEQVIEDPENSAYSKYFDL